VFPFRILGAKDTLLGPVMRSTGEGVGIADTTARAYRKALRSIGKDLRRPHGGDPRRALLRVAARDRSACVEIARRLRALGFDLSASPETAELLRAMRVPHDLLDDALPEGSVGLAVVTAETAAEVAESRALRQRALLSGVTCVTTVDLARSVCSAMEESGSTESVRTLQEWLGLMGRPGEPTSR
jgi:carbamoyl-phosphate synthase large subunit